MAAPITSNRDPKTCTGCGLEKPLTEFSEKRPRGRSQAVKLYASRCRMCMVAKATRRANGPKRASILAYKRDYWRRVGSQPVKWREDAYRRNYGSSLTAYDIQFASQNGRCGLCGRLPAEGEQRFAFDHDHETGLTRSVLCPSCNGGLGCFKDDPVLLRAALSYLTEWGEKHVSVGKHGL